MSPAYIACRFHYMALADNKLRLMPSPEDMTDARSEQLAYKEARLLTNPIEPSLKGEVRNFYVSWTLVSLKII